MTIDTRHLPTERAALPAPTRWRRERWDEPGTIYFWSGRRGQFDRRFSNFAETPFPMAGLVRPRPGRPVRLPASTASRPPRAATTAEHERIRLARSPLEAKRAGRRVALPADWNRQRTHVMLAVVRAKFAVPELGELLLYHRGPDPRRGLALRPRVGLPRPRGRLHRPEPPRPRADARPRRASLRRQRRATRRSPRDDRPSHPAPPHAVPAAPARDHPVLRARRRQRPPHRAAPPAPRRPAAEASAMSQLYIVEVDDHCNPTLSGHSGCSYTSPPQPEVQALALVRALLELHAGPAHGRRRPMDGADRRRPADHPPARRPARRPAHRALSAARPRSSCRCTVRRLSPVTAEISS